MSSIAHLSLQAAQQQHSKAAEHAGKFDAARFSAELSKHVAPKRTVVDIQKTHLTLDEASSALAAAYKNVTGKVANQETVKLITAQWAHETAGGKSMLNYNFGGIKGTGPSGLSIAAQTREGYGDNSVTIRDHFRAYGSAEEGATDYVSLLQRRFPEALDAAQTGDVQAFAGALKKSGYFTDSVENYSKGLARWAGDVDASGALGRLPAQKPEHVPVPMVNATAWVLELERSAMRIALNPKDDLPFG